MADCTHIAEDPVVGELHLEEVDSPYVGELCLVEQSPGRGCGGLLSQSPRQPGWCPELMALTADGPGSAPLQLPATAGNVHTCLSSLLCNSC